MKCHVTGLTRSFTSKAGNVVNLFEVYITLPNSPYPQKIDVFGDAIPAGFYDVPLTVDIYNGRLNATLDFKKAKPLEESK